MAISGPAVTGMIVLPDGTELPADATWTVELQDTSLADAPAVVMGTDTGVVEDMMATEIPFVVSYDPASIDERFIYTLSARVEDIDDTLLYINDTMTPGLVEGEPLQDVAVEVIDVQAATAAAEEMMAEAEESPEA